MKREYDFSKAERGRFFKPGMKLNIPVYLEPDVARSVLAQAQKRTATMDEIVNEFLRKAITRRPPKVKPRISRKRVA